MSSMSMGGVTFRVQPGQEAQFENGLAALEILKGMNCRMLAVSLVAGVALLIIACLGAADKIPAVALGYTVIGLSGVSLFSMLKQPHLKELKISIAFQVAIFALLVSLSALGIVGTLSATQVGYGVLTSILARGFLEYCLEKCTGEQAALIEKKKKEMAPQAIPPVD